MNNIITINDFTGDIQLSVSDFQKQNFDNFIAQKQPVYLRKVLGVQLYNELAAADTSETKWSKLIQGCDYVWSDVYYHFYGLKRGFAYYIFAEWIKSDTVKIQNGGSFIVKNENATDVVPVANDVYAQNECMIEFEELDAFITNDLSTYPSYLGNAPYDHIANIFGL